MQQLLYTEIRQRLHEQRRIEGNTRDCPSFPTWFANGKLQRTSLLGTITLDSKYRKNGLYYPALAEYICLKTIARTVAKNFTVIKIFRGREPVLSKRTGYVHVLEAGEAASRPLERVRVRACACARVCVRVVYR